MNMHWVCPICGFQNDAATEVCMCGYQAEASGGVRSPGSDASEALQSGGGRSLESSLKSTDTEASLFQARSDKIKVRVTEKPEISKSDQAGDEAVIREIDAWKVTYSGSDQCIYLGTPALQSFRLKLTLGDVEELLEFMYAKSGKERITRKISGDTTRELVSLVDKIIEEKKSKTKLVFSDDEMQAVSDMINEKLME